MDMHERAVLAGLTQAMLATGAQSVTLAQVFTGCGRRIPSPVLLEVLGRLAQSGLVQRSQSAGAEVVPLAVNGRAPARAPAPPPGPQESFAITEAGFLLHTHLSEEDAAARAETLPAALAAERIGDRERAIWAELYDYLSWQPERSLHLANHLMRHRLAGREAQRLQDLLVRVGLIERALAETHVRLTEFGRRVPRLPG